MKSVHSLIIVFAALLIAPSVFADKKTENAERLADQFILLFARDGDKVLVQKMLKSGTNVNVMDENQATALHHASNMGHVEIAQILIEAGAKVDARNDTGMTPLCLAAMSGKKEAAALLIKNKADINVSATNGLTPLLAATAKDRFDVVKLLLDSGVKADAKNKDGLTALRVADILGFDRIADLLRSHESK